MERISLDIVSLVQVCRSHILDISSHLMCNFAPDPFKVIKTGPNEEYKGDPTTILQKELAVHRYVKIPEVPTFTGGAIGYVAYDCIQHFEPKTTRKTRDTLGIPEAIFMLVDTVPMEEIVRAFNFVIEKGWVGIRLF